ncbi:hypothetical protein R4K02_02660 [Pseudomonas aeruginosa]|uniref:hypothetical protein n=1 Tax=Pseudomonas aeruginosa TaxID=287 RepID=UPI002953AB80|nr:hypothetical protein [Pseudomonas aeruginosa]MDV7975945.1 hypothetical protein [Pseudomonas aeruginosa]
MRSQDLHQRLADLGAKPLHCGRIVRAWLQGRALDACTARQRAEDFLPLGVRHGLPQVAAELEGIARLHSTRAELRRQLLPKAPPLSPEELVEAGEAYARRVDYPIQYQWTLLEGINDSLEEMDGILRLLKGRFAVMNLIPYNSMDGDAYRRPSGERIVELVRYLHSRGVLTKVRNSAGQDIDGGCGQLRARATQGTVERRIPARQA